MTIPKKLRFRLVILTLIGLRIVSGPDPILTEPPKAVATTLAMQLTRDHWIIDTFAGGEIGDNAPAIQARLDSPRGVAVDGAGNLYIADTDNDRIRRVDPSGTITTVAGTGETGFSGDGGPAARARLDFPQGLAVDDTGNLFIADSGNHRIRRVDPSGIITTVAGRGERGFSGDGGPAIRAQFDYPLDVALDSAGNLFIADSGNHRIRRVGPSGAISTIAGSSKQGFSGDGDPAVTAQLRGPAGVAVDSAGNLFIADSGNHRIRRVGPSGTISTIAGSMKQGFSGDGDPAVIAQLWGPTGVAVDSAGNLFIADSGNDRIRRVDPSGTISTIAGTRQRRFSGDNGPATQARLHAPFGLATDNAGNLFIADYWNHRIRRVDPTGTISTIAGTGERGHSGDGGPAVAARLNSPDGIVVDSAGNLFIADSSNHRIRRVGPLGTITTIAGTGAWGFGGDNGPATQARLNSPSGLATDNAGNLFIADTRNQRIRRVDPSGTITTVAGTGETGFSGDGGPAVAARLNNPTGIAVDGAGNLFIADTTNHRIRRVEASGTITTIAGTGEPGFGGDGGLAADAQLNLPYGVAVDGAGSLFIADAWNNRIRRVDPSGTITTFAGPGRIDFGPDEIGDDGPAADAQLHLPSDVAVDAAGSLFIADFGNHRIRRVDPSGTITTFAGTGEPGFSGDNGPAAAAQLQRPAGLAVDTAGNLFIADSWNHRIRRVDPSGTITTFAGTGEPGFSGDNGPAVAMKLRRPEGVAVDSAGNLFIADSRNNRIRRVDLSGTLTTIAGTGERGFSGDGGPAAEARLASPGGLVLDVSGNLYVADTINRRVRILTQTKTPITLPGPTGLTATTVSGSRIELTWKDNSENETGFRIERRQGVSAQWGEVGTTATNVTRYSDAGLQQSTTYRYRVQAFNSAGVSTYSNEAMATTAGLAPTVSGFAPTGGPVGTWVTVTGTRFLGATEVSFNGVTSREFEVQSMTRLRTVVPSMATSGPISVVTPGGAGVSADSFAVTEAGIHSRRFVPIVLRLGGQAGSYYTSELTLTNRGSQQAGIGYSYTASIGSGSGAAVDSLGPGEQRIVPDAIAYLTSLGMPIGRGGAGGTLQVDFSGLTSAADGDVTVRTSTPVPGGRVGLAYPGLNATQLLDGPAWLTGLRQNNQDRSNLALQNAGRQGITLRVTVFSGDPVAPGSRVLPEISLGPGEFHQYNAVLATAGFRQGYAKVEKTGGISPYYAYGVINDQANSDGSFVFPVTEDSLTGKSGQTLPVIVETEFFHSELTVTNVSPSARTVHFSLVADAIRAANSTAPFSLSLQAGEQRIIPKLIRQLRQEGLAGIGPPGPVIAGAVFATLDAGDMSGIVIGARTGSPGGGGQYGVFYHAVPYGAASASSAWIHGLQQNSENRSNLGLVNTGEVDGSPSDFSIDIHDGDTGRLVSTVSDLTVPARGWRQVNRILAQYAPGTRQGYVQVRQTSGNNLFIAYGVINDGAAPGQRSGDGFFLTSQPQDGPETRNQWADGRRIRNVVP